MAEMKTLTINGQTFEVVDETARSAASSAASAAATAQKTADGKEASGTAASAVSAHNSDTSAHSDIRTALGKKADDYSIELYNGNGGVNGVKFMTVDYSTCNSENGVAVKVGMVSGHGNGSSYAFLQDAIFKVGHTGTVSVDNFKYYGASAATTSWTHAYQDYNYGDIFWVIDTTNKIVDFYCVMGQYATLEMTPYRRVTHSSGGTITQHTDATVYSSGTRVWANNSNIALMSEVNAAIEAAVGAVIGGSY